MARKFFGVIFLLDGQRLLVNSELRAVFHIVLALYYISVLEAHFCVNLS
jgi:hypothetical protein